MRPWQAPLVASGTSHTGRVWIETRAKIKSALGAWTDRTGALCVLAARLGRTEVIKRETAPLRAGSKSGDTKTGKSKTRAHSAGNGVDEEKVALSAHLAGETKI